MRCSNCGTENNEGLLFCEICGASLRKEVPPEPKHAPAPVVEPEPIVEAQPEPDPIIEPQPEPATMPEQVTLPSPEPEAKTDGKGTAALLQMLKKTVGIGKVQLPLVAVAAAAVVLVVAVILVVTLSGRTPVLSEDQLALIQGDWYEDGDLADWNLYILDSTWSYYFEGSLVSLGDLKADKDGSIIGVDDEDTVVMRIEPVNGMLEVDEGGYLTAYYSYEDSVQMTNASPAPSVADPDDTDPPYDPYDIDLPGNAALDDSVVIDSLGMILNFPSEVFMVDSVDDNYAQIFSLKGDAFIEVCSAQSFEITDTTTIDYIIDKHSYLANNALDRFLVNATDVYRDELQIERRDYPDMNMSVLNYVIGEADCMIADTRMRVICRVSRWLNISDQTNYLIYTALIAPEESYDFYLEYFDRVVAAMDDVRGG